MDELPAFPGLDLPREEPSGLLIDVPQDYTEKARTARTEQVRSESVDLNLHDAIRLAFMLQHDGAYDQAERIFRDCLIIDHHNAHAMHGMGLCRAQEGRSFEESLEWYDKAMRIIREEMVALTCNRARSLSELGRSEEALALIDGLLRSAPGYIEGHFNRGLVLMQLHRYAEAIVEYDRVVGAIPNHVEAKFARGWARLVMGDYLSGFEGYEYRYKPEVEIPDDRNGNPCPLWTGTEPLEGKTILVRQEEGLGDNILFMRYLPMLRERGARVLVATDANMAPLLRGMEVVGVDHTKWPPIDFWVRFMSLARCFRTSAIKIPAPMAPLRNPAKTLAWKRLTATDKKLKVGLVWSGNPKAKYDAHRSIPFAQLTPLLEDFPHIEFFGLQRDVRLHDRDMLARSRVRDLSAHLTDFGETAHALEQMDIVLTPCTSLAHLAATLGRPTWVMLTNYRTFWLWGDGSKMNCPWYPSARLFRQQTTGDWGSVTARVAEELETVNPRSA